MTAPVDSRRMVFREWFGLTAAQADLLSVLFGEESAITAPELALRAGVVRSAICTHVSAIRRALDTEALDRDGDGYRLTQAGRAECLAALWTLGEELRHAA